MTMVWIVTAGDSADESERHVCGVFSSEEKAEDYIKQLRTKKYPYSSIYGVPWPLDRQARSD